MSEVGEIFKELNKDIRDKRMNRFELDVIPSFINFGYSFESSNDGTKYTTTHPEFGIIDIYPKANKLLIRKQNKWIKPAVNWMTTHFKPLKYNL